MCGVIAILGSHLDAERFREGRRALHHRGPDASGEHLSDGDLVYLGHTRLRVIDLSDAGNQPLADPTGRFQVVFNGEIYNYRELRGELESGYSFQTKTDTEVLLAAYARWGLRCLEKLLGMFAFVIWDGVRRELIAVRDRFGVKPLFYGVLPGGGVAFASEIKALHRLGIPQVPDEVAWSTYLTLGMYDHSERTFWKGVSRVPAGAIVRVGLDFHPVVDRWYDLARRVLEEGVDVRPEDAVVEEATSLLKDSVSLRFRSDVPVGVCLSGGLDSSLLLALISQLDLDTHGIKTFTFSCGDARYDETHWVESLLQHYPHPSCGVNIVAAQVPSLASIVQSFQDEPFGGIPTLAMAEVFRSARENGVTVLLDGNGIDEAWGGYDYYQRAGHLDKSRGPTQGSQNPCSLEASLDPAFAGLAAGLPEVEKLADSLTDLQYRDLCFAKIPRATRFNDRVSMMSSRELREPFLDHRLVELGLRQPWQRKLDGLETKKLIRVLSRRLLPQDVRSAPKRSIQTPQREWLVGPLGPWVTDCVESALGSFASAWFLPDQVWSTVRSFMSGVDQESSFHIWQLINIALIAERPPSAPPTLG